MKKGTKIGLAVGGVALIIGGIFWYKKSKEDKNSNKTTNDGNNSDNETINNTTQAVTIDDAVFPLKKGSKGKEVKILQHYLNTSSLCQQKMPKPSPTTRIRPLLPLVEDGIFGNRTEAVLNVCKGTNVVNSAIDLENMG